MPIRNKMEYILFIHKNNDSQIPEKEWNVFFEEAKASGLFLGGSEIGARIQFGEKTVSDITQNIGGFMRFESTNLDPIKSLLNKHPIINHGGTIELCEMPKT